MTSKRTINNDKGMKRIPLGTFAVEKKQEGDMTVYLGAILSTDNPHAFSQDNNFIYAVYTPNINSCYEKARDLLAKTMVKEVSESKLIQDLSDLFGGQN